MGEVFVVGSQLRSLGMLVAAVRLGAGVGLGGAPSRFLRWESVPLDSSMPLLLRTVGVRDLAVGAGTLAALTSGSDADLRRWVAAGLLSDSLDVVAGLAASRTTGRRGLSSALIAAPMVMIGIAALRDRNMESLS